MAIVNQIDTFAAANALSTAGLGASGEGESWILFEVTGTFTATLSFFGSLTPAGATALLPIAVANMNAPATFVTTVTAPGLYKAEITGLSNVLVKCTAYTSGTATVAYSHGALGGGS